MERPLSLSLPSLLPSQAGRPRVRKHTILGHKEAPLRSFFPGLTSKYFTGECEAAVPEALETLEALEAPVRATPEPERAGTRDAPALIS